MKLYKKELCKTLLSRGSFRIMANPKRSDGYYELHSGRLSPYFMNLGEMNTGPALLVMGAAYADCIQDVIKPKRLSAVYGPAYKGIPLAAATAMQFYAKYSFPVGYCTNRKEVKDHGDAGLMMGCRLEDGDRVVIVEDVVTSGQSIEEAIAILRAQAKVQILGTVVTFDRMECSASGESQDLTALEEVFERTNVPVYSILSIADVVEYLHEEGQLTKDFKKALEKYYAEYAPAGLTKNWQW